MTEATNPITTASNPRVGEDVGRLACEELARIRAIIPASLSYEVPDAAEAIASTFREYVKVAAEATALRKQIAALAGLRDCSIHSVSDGENGRHRIQIGCPDLSTTQDLREALDSIRKASVASTGSGKEETKGEPSGTGSREPGPSVPACGFDPSREAVEMMAEHLHEEEGNDLVWRWPEHADDDGYRGNGGYVTITPTDVQCRLREKARRVLIRANQIRARGALAGEAAQAAETHSGSVHEHAAPQGATPEATPKPSPSQTPVDPQMTVGTNPPRWRDLKWCQANYPHLKWTISGEPSKPVWWDDEYGWTYPHNCLPPMRSAQCKGGA